MPIFPFVSNFVSTSRNERMLDKNSKITETVKDKIKSIEYFIELVKSLGKSDTQKQSLLLLRQLLTECQTQLESSMEFIKSYFDENAPPDLLFYMKELDSVLNNAGVKYELNKYVIGDLELQVFYVTYKILSLHTDYSIEIQCRVTNVVEFYIQTYFGHKYQEPTKFTNANELLTILKSLLASDNMLFDNMFKIDPEIGKYDLYKLSPKISNVQVLEYSIDLYVDKPLSDVEVNSILAKLTSLFLKIGFDIKNFQLKGKLEPKVLHVTMIPSNKPDISYLRSVILDNFNIDNDVLDKIIEEFSAKMVRKE